MPPKTDRQHPGNLGRALLLLRQSTKKLQKTVARELGYSPARLSQYELGKAEPTFANLRYILDSMGFDLHDVQNVLDAIEGRPPRNPAPPPPELDPLTREEQILRSVVRGLMALFALRQAREVKTRE